MNHFYLFGKSSDSGSANWNSCVKERLIAGVKLLIRARLYTISIFM